MCASRSQLPPRSLGPAPSPCLTHNDHFLFPQPKVKVQIQFVVLHLWISTPKKMLTSRVEPSDVCLPNNRTPASGLKWSQTCSCNNCLFTLVCVKSAFKVSNLLIRFKTPQINLLWDSLQLTWPGMLTNYNLKSGTSFVQLDFGTMIATQPNVPNEAWPTFPVPWWSSSLPRHPPGLTY